MASMDKDKSARKMGRDAVATAKRQQNVLHAYDLRRFDGVGD
jgi:hypothetical protein